MFLKLSRSGINRQPLCDGKRFVRQNPMHTYILYGNLHAREVVTDFTAPKLCEIEVINTRVER